MEDALPSTPLDGGTPRAQPHALPVPSPAGDRLAVWTLRLLVGLGILAVAYYFTWWGDGGRIQSPLLALMLILAALYHWTQLICSWIIYLAARRREERRVDPDHCGRTIDVFVTACNEPAEIVERSLRAALRMRGLHRCWLLDDGRGEVLRSVARRLGAGYMRRPGRRDRKAGNINAALARTEGDLVVIFDADHAPRPDFLERTVGYFDDPRVGFVQAMLSFRNRRQSWFARAAGETALDFFNPTCRGMDRLGSATLIGSNAVIRREALQSIGGYKSGLAEDLATSIELHARGWKSAYVAAPLAPGLAPSGLKAWFTQQLKWSRGVFEVLLTAYPRLFRRLTWGQRLAYAVRTTYYWTGPVTAIHMAFTAATLIGGERVARIDLQQYVLHFTPLVAAVLAIRFAALRLWRHPSVRPGLLWRALVLVNASWPVYTAAWLMALLRVPLGFRLTPKGREALRKPWLPLLPQILSSLLIAAALLLGLTRNPSGHVGILLAFLVLQGTPQLLLIWHSHREPA